MSPVPPKDVQRAATRAVGWIGEGRAGRGFTDTGRRRAKQLADGDDVSRAVVGRMRDYFARHDVDKDADGFRRGTEGYPSPGRVAWDAWGGDAGQRWSNSKAFTDD
ncbi:hypothetical protein [Phycicoccus sonneratiae]|uniref:Uncharacterized protein n=1 Tax=Phycicoccus sonneratiae TaxID=2807628 RepID=A0ABS2CMT9_9MICO|nr:hypothetical protein [Phycicoccus sonneraticus]MBM6401193.1 hypothetical protein [Phycicoccus sonneraticus]